MSIFKTNVSTFVSAALPQRHSPSPQILAKFMDGKKKSQLKA